MTAMGENETTETEADFTWRKIIDLDTEAGMAEARRIAANRVAEQSRR